MKLFFFLLLGLPVALFAQSFQVQVMHSVLNKPLENVTVHITGTDIGAISDSLGFAYFPKTPEGNYTLRFSLLGFVTVTKMYRFPHITDEIPLVFLEPGEIELEGIIVTSTRSRRPQKDEPNTVETIDEEELEEKLTMEASNISMLLNESPGIEMRSGSVFTGSSGFVIQGLESRYTLLLRDGFPASTGYSGSLSLQQIAPLDLRQVEIIKGSVSTLYGSGAIGGLVNLLSKQPTENWQRTILLNTTSAGGYDISSFMAKQYGTLGSSFFASYNAQKAFDGNEDDITDLPKESRITLSPRLFFVEGPLVANIGARYISEERTGGSLPDINSSQGTPKWYTHTTKASRLNINGELMREFEGGDLQIRGQYHTYTEKGNLNNFNEAFIAIYPYFFRDYTSVSDIGFADITWHSGNFVTGIVWEHNSFEYNRNPFLTESYNMYSAFAQYSYNPGDQIIIEPGLRLDVRKSFTPVIIPRLAFLYSLTDNFSFRISYGGGYKNPDGVNDLIEGPALQFADLKSNAPLQREVSSGIMAQLQIGHLELGALEVSLNQAAFINTIKNKVRYYFNLSFASRTGIDGLPPYIAHNMKGSSTVSGTETTLKIELGSWMLNAAYTYTTADEDDVIDVTCLQSLTYNIRHRAGATLIYEGEDIKAGYELYLTGEQIYEGNTGRGPGFAVQGLFAEKMFGAFSVFINFENLFNTKQNSPDVYRPFNAAKQYAKPFEGRVINGGVKIRW